MSKASDHAEAFANFYLNVPSLETLQNDSQDFHSVPVWSIKAALEAAYRQGVADVKAMLGAEVDIDKMDSSWAFHKVTKSLLE